MASIYANTAVADASAAFRHVVLTLYGIPIPEGHEQSTLESCGAIVGNLINTVGQDSDLFKKAQAKYALIAQAWTVFCNARVAAAVTAASAAFRTLFQEVYGDTIPEGQEQLTFDSRVVKVGKIVKEVGLNSDAFKEAAAKYALIAPAWTAFFNARAGAE